MITSKADGADLYVEGHGDASAGLLDVFGRL
jgi:hypothetical protein